MTAILESTTVHDAPDDLIAHHRGAELTVHAPFPESLRDPERAAAWLADLEEEAARRGLPVAASCV